MNEFDADENFNHDFEEDFDELQPCLGNDDSDDDYSLESLSSQEQFYEGWAGEKFLFRVYLHHQISEGTYQVHEAAQSCIQSQIQHALKQALNVMRKARQRPYPT